MLILGSGSLWFPQHFVAEQPVVSLPVLSLAFNVAAFLHPRWPEVEPAEADEEPIVGPPLPVTAMLTDQLLFISVLPFTVSVHLWQYSEEHRSVIHSTQEAACVSSKGAWKVINCIAFCSPSSRPLPPSPGCNDSHRLPLRTTLTYFTSAASTPSACCL